MRPTLGLPKTNFTLKWPVRLSVRTPGFQPGKTSSILVRAAITKLNILVLCFFSFIAFYLKFESCSRHVLISLIRGSFVRVAISASGVKDLEI